MNASNRPAIGIDLGTTNSMVAYLDRQARPCTVSNAFGELLTPSAVLIRDDEILVGREAMRGAVLEAESYAESFKRDMGSPSYRQQLRGQNVPPEVLSAIVLAHLKKYATEVVGTFENVVVTVPAFFDEARRRCTQEAARLAGLNAIDIINEPTAAAVAYAFHKGVLESSNGFPKRENILVYDLGGGTFDVTILSAEGWEFQAITTDGDVKLGGRDFDERIVNYVAELFLETHGVDPRSDLEKCTKLWLDAEQAKHTLSSRSKAVIPVAMAGIQMTVELTRQQFQSITSDLIGRTEMSLKLVMGQANMTWADVDRILMVGGATRMPAVSDLLYRISGKRPEQFQAPDEIVAHGAALFAGMLMKTHPESVLNKLKLVNVNSHSVGVVGRDMKTNRQVVHALIPKNTPLPTSVTQVFPLAQQDQRKVTVPIVEGESSQPAECVRLGNCVVDDLPPNLPAGTPTSIQFTLDESGLLTINAEVTGARRSARLEIARENSSRNDSLPAWIDFLQGKKTEKATNGQAKGKSVVEQLDEAYTALGQIALWNTLPNSLSTEKNALMDLVKQLEAARTVLSSTEQRQSQASNRADRIRLQSEYAQHQSKIRQWEQQYGFLLLHLGRRCFETKVALPQAEAVVERCRNLRSQMN